MLIDQPLITYHVSNDVSIGKRQQVANRERDKVLGYQLRSFVIPLMELNVPTR